MKTPMHVTPIERGASDKARTALPSAALAPTATRNDRGANLCAALVVLLLTSFAAAQTLTGKVNNSTTGNPSAGDEIIVFKLGKGMEESGRAKTDATGQFSFKLDDPRSPYLVRAIHQGVTYHRVVLPGTTSLAIEVSDVGTKVEGVQVVVDIMRIQMAQDHIVVTRDFGVRNTSNPPRTQVNEHNLEFYVPDHAHLIGDSAMATSENGNPLKSVPVPERDKNRYSFTFPLRPGFTHFEVAYELPYSGSANLDPKSIYPLQNFVVIIPKAMQFHATAGSTGFKLMNNPNQPNASVRVATNTREGQNLAFSISGEGTIDTGQQSGTQHPVESAQSSAASAPPRADSPRADSINRSGGGLGPPIDASDLLQRYRWWIFVGSAAVLLIGGVYVASRQQSKARSFGRKMGLSPLRSPMQDEAGYQSADILEATRAPGAQPTSALMDGIKEELFRIEMERKRGRISSAEYQNAKNALGQTLDRVLRREAQKA
ncbi:MAG: hypothetical protein ACYDDS_15785 [Candidatus Sulfotelmatobacter sp.]